MRCRLSSKKLRISNPEKKAKKNVVRKQQIAKNYFVSQQRRQRHLYNELTQWLRLSQDELIVLADKKAPTEGSQTTSPLHISDDRLIRRASDAEEQSQKIMIIYSKKLKFPLQSRVKTGQLQNHQSRPNQIRNISFPAAEF